MWKLIGHWLDTNVSTMDNLGKWFGAFSRMGKAAGEVEVLLMVSGFDVVWGAETKLFNMYANMKKDGMGERCGPGKLECMFF